MEQLSKLIASKVGITQEQAEQAIEMVLNFLKDKLPPTIGNYLEQFMDDENDSGIDLDDAAKLIGGLLNKKKK